MAEPVWKFLFVSSDGLHLDCAWRVLREGHEVRYFIENKDEADIGDGFVPKVDAWEPHVDWADVIIFDVTKMTLNNGVNNFVDVKNRLTSNKIHVKMFLT